MPSCTRPALNLEARASARASGDGAADQANSLSPLPETEAEVGLLKELYGSQHSKIYTGANASEERLKSEAASYRILRSYVAVIAYRACHLHLRRKYPQRYSLKNRLRYFLTHQPGFALWESEAEEWLAGFAPWRHQTALAALPDHRLAKLRVEAQTFLKTPLPRDTTGSIGLLELICFYSRGCHLRAACRLYGSIRRVACKNLESPAG